MFDIIAQRRKQLVEEQPLTIQGFPKGLNTFDSSKAIQKDELAASCNYYFNNKGDLIPRPGLVKFTTTPLDGNAYDSEVFRIAGVLETIVTTTTFKVYRINSAGVPTLIGATAGLTNIFLYDDWCVLCDSSYLKYLDRDGILSMAYDAGEDNGLYDKTDEVSDGTIKIHTGQERAGVKITFPTFTGGSKIPLTNVNARVKKLGTPTGNMVAELYQGTSLLATSSNDIDVSTILVTEQTILFNFDVDTSDKTGWMESNTEYRVVLVYAAGDTNNCIELATITDGDLDGTNWTGVWVDGLESALMFLAPNLPPKAGFGLTTLKRPFLGGDPDNTGWVWYGNVSIFDWSTPNGGGWIGIIDDSRTSNPIGGLGSLYGELYAFGKEEAPYLSKLTGAQPSEYQLLDSFKAVAATHKTIVNRPNDIWLSRETGTNNLLGTDRYGSTRTYSQASKVLNKFDENWDNANSNIAGFIESLNLYILFIEGMDTVLVCHTALPFQRSNVEGDVGFPWSEFKFPSLPTMLSSNEDKFLLGLDDGHVYKFETEALDDDGTEIEFLWRTAFVEFPFYNVDLNRVQALGSGKGGLTYNLNIYTEMNDTDIVQTIPVDLGQTGLLVVAALMLVLDANFPVIGGSVPTIYPINIRCSTVMLEGTDLVRYFYAPSVITGSLMKYKNLEN